jgi:hypothetical protein
VYLGFALAWFAEHHLLSDEFVEDWGAEIAQLTDRTMTPIAFGYVTGGTLSSDMLNNAGNAFATALFEGDAPFYEMLETSLATNTDSPYLVADSWHNAELLFKHISDFYSNWINPQAAR